MSHAATRARERYGIDLCVADLAQIMLDITDAVLGQRRVATLQRRDRNGTEIWFVRAHGQTMRVRYAPDADWIISVLPVRDRFAAPVVDRQRLAGRGRREGARVGRE